MSTARSPWSERSLSLLVALLALSALCWLVVALIVNSMQMNSMQGASGTGTALDAAAFLAAWLAMMAAMMLPAALPMVTIYGATAQSRTRTLLFVAGYLVVWGSVGLTIYAGYSVVHGNLLTMRAFDGFGPTALALALAAAVLYQLSPLKDRCLARCRAPLAQIVRGWRDGPAGAIRMGAEHGLWCVGCCAGLMVVLLAVGTMSLMWMVVVALVILAEKTMPLGFLASRITTLALAVATIAVAADAGILT